MNVITWLEFELAYYDFAVQQVNHYVKQGTHATSFLSLLRERIFLVELIFSTVNIRYNLFFDIVFI